jgi:tetratricopeptide (TPR) repeat protein
VPSGIYAWRWQAALLLWAAALVGLPIGGLYSQPTCADPRAAVSSSPEDEYAWIALGRCLLSAGLLEEAIEALRQAVQVAPGNIQTYDELGIAYVRAGLLREAWELYRRVQDHGLATGVHQALAEEYLNAGEWEKAELELRHTIALGHYDRSTLDLCRDLALRYLAMGNRAGAKSLLTLVFDLRPEDQRTLEALQGLLLEEGAHDEAEALQLRYLIHQYETRYAIASAQLRRERIETRIRLAELYVKLGRLEAAARVLEDAIEINGDVDVPAAVRARLLLASVYCRLGRSEQARRQWERVVQLEPSNQEAREQVGRPEGERCP